MKRSLLIAFLLVLYIGPSLFIVSYASPAIPIEPNMNKDYSVAQGGSWYNENWTYRKSIDIYVDTQVGPYWQVRIPVTYENFMQSDFDDIRFAEWGGSILESYWRESYTASTSAVFWVKITEELDANYTIYMYYGNDAVSTTSNGTETFEVYEDWTSESIRLAVWDIVASDGSVSYAAGGASHGFIAKFDANAGASYQITTDYDTDAPIAVMFRSNIEETSAGNTARQGSGFDGAFALNLVQSSIVGEIFFVYDDDGNQDSQTMDLAYFDAWITFQITRDGTNSKLYADDVLIETASCAPDNVATNPAASIRNTDSEDDIYSDWVVVRKFVINEPVFDSFGSREPPPDWELVGYVDLLFTVPFDYWAFDMILILLGLVMVILSSLYAAYKIRNNPDRDTLAIVLLLFMFGFALFLGGIGIVGGG